MMDPPPLVPSLSNITTTPSTTTLQNRPDSVESSPRYCHNHIVETWPDHHHVHDHEPLPHVPNAKLRLMCSYGGHIMPRPHDKSLSYIGGDTRIVAVDRHSSLKDLYARLSHSLLHGRPFTLKYQLPNEDLDNLITLATDEDLDHMIQEHDRLASSKLSPSSRLRMFLFLSKPDTTVSMGALSLLDDAKSQTWFVDALNNSGIHLQRGVSDSAATDRCLVNLVDGVPESNDLEAQYQVVVGDSSNKEVKQEMQYSVGDSPMVENNLFYGSSSMANLPPVTIRVHVDENGGSGTSRIQQDQQRVVMEEHFAQMSFGATGVKHLLDDGYAMSSAAAAPNMNGNAIPAAVTMVTTTTTTDDDRSESDHHGAPAGYRKPPLPLQLVQPPRTSGGFSLPSPDSVASDSSIASTNSFSKTVYYHEQAHAAHVDNKAPAMPNVKSEISDQSPLLQREQVQDSGYTLPQQLDQNHQLQHQQQQQQFVYIHHPAATSQVPMSSYYSLYAPQSQQQLHHPIGQQQYPVYVMPVGHTQPYNMTLQSNMADPNVVSASGRPLIPQSAAASAAYKDGAPPTPTIPEVAPTVYKATIASNPAFVHIPSNQFQQQYVGLPQNIHHQQHQIATANYGYDQYDGGPTRDQVHYSQQKATTLQPPQYQSMTPAAAAAALPDVSKQFPMDNIQHPNRNSQPVQIN